MSDEGGRRATGGPASGSVALSARHISKAFGGAHALIDVDLEIRRGEVLGLVGENGSGKSTLIKILGGYHAPDAGELEVGGKHIHLPLHAGQSRQLGMEFVHQDLGLIPTLSVTENLRISRIAEGHSVTRISWREERRRTREALKRYGVELDPRASVEDLPPVEQALLAIVRAIESMRAVLAENESHAGLLVLDEATVFLPRDHVQQLFGVVRDLAAEGSSVLLVSHELEEVREITDRITVLRNGRLVDTVETASTSEDELIRLIIGHELKMTEHRSQGELSGGAVTVRDLRGERVGGVSFDVRRGEVLGLTGLVGSGFEQAPYLLFGAERAEEGTLALDGATIDVRSMNPIKAVALGAALVPGNRQRDGGVLGLPIVDNVMLPKLSTYFQGATLRRAQLKKQAHSLMSLHDVRPLEPAMEFGSLSGGNQQKVLMGKWLQTEPTLLLLHEPTQGVDIGAREAIFAVIAEATARGCATVCASADYEQLALICDRVLIFAEGQIVNELVGPEVTKEHITAQCLSSIRPVTLPHGSTTNDDQPV